MAEDHNGRMDISQNEKTFEGFIRLSVRVAIAVIAVLIFLAIFNS